MTFVTKNRWQLPAAARSIALEEIEQIHDNEAFIHAGVVMPDHVHLIAQPLWDGGGALYGLAEIHQIRSDESLVGKIDYVIENPVRAGLVQRVDDYPWIFRWWRRSGTG